MKKVFSFVLFCSLISFVSCLDHPSGEVDDPIIEPTESSLFDWKVIHSLTLKVTVPSVEGDINKYYRMVQLFSDNSFESSALIASGVAKPNESFVTSLSIPKATGKLYLMVKDAAGQAKRYEIALDNSQSELTVNSGELKEYSVETRGLRADSYVAPEPPAVTIPTDFDYVLNATDGFPDIMEDGKTYYIPRGVTVKVDNNTTFSNTLWHTAPQAAIYVAGKLEISSVAGYKINSKSFYILDGGKIEAEDFYYNHEALRNQELTLYIGQGGSLVSKANVSLANSRTTIINGGTVDCETFYVRNGFGKEPSMVHVKGRVSCKKFSMQWNYDNRLFIYGYSLVEASESGVLGGGTATMYRNSILYFKTSVAFPNVNIIVPESEYSDEEKGVALFRLETTTMGSDRNLAIDGPLEIYAPMFSKESLYTTLESGLSNGAYVTKTLNDRQVYIGSGEHNYNKGYGMFEIIDADGDGVPNTYDEDDINPEVASSFSYPLSDDYATLMYEDLWPHTGDYDMNDVVTDIRVDWSTNNDNRVSAMVLKWRLRAAGSTKNIGMALQLDQIATAEIATVKHSREIAGNAPFSVNKGMETGVSQAIIPLFNRIEDILERDRANASVNAHPNGPYVQPHTESISITFASPIEISRVNMDQLNFFITVDERDHEIHLANFKQTAKGKTLVAKNNNLDPNNQYKTADTGMMWGLMVPRSIAYPKEMTSIESVYSRYKAWYSSNGTSNQDWYLDSPNASNAYVEPSDETAE
ncbi:LruC domain-containing protein [Parabacteroides sp. OttesenSCG-928-N08]|nr:LruC domain-containing protein [Parabacteroides sp. OttesenSCG-928-N08]